MHDNGNPPTVVYQVNRVLKFAGGGAVSLPIRQFTDQNEAIQAKDALHAAYVKRTQDPAVRAVLSEIGVIGFEHGIMPIQAPDSRIVVPTPRLVIPR